MVTRDFDAMLADRAGVRPTFKVAGQEFTMRARLASKKYFELQHYFQSEDTSEEDSLRKLFNTVLIKGDRDRFFQLFDGALDEDNDEVDDELVLDVTQLDAMTTWVMEFYSGKQPKNSESSNPGTDSTGPRPKVVSLNARGA